MFIGLLYIVLLFLVVVSFFEDEKIHNQKLMMVIFVLVITLCSAFRPEGVDKDYLSYLGYFYDPTSGMALLTEPTFKLICGIARFLETPLFIFVVYAFLAIPLKAYSIAKISPFCYLSFLVWFTHLYIVQDLTQIRFAVASAVYLFSLPYLADGRKKLFLLLTLVAILFHYSALFLLPIVFVGNKPLSRKWIVVLLLLPFIFYICPVVTADLLAVIPIPFIQEKILVYQEMQKYSDMFTEINIYNVMALCRLFTYYMLIWKYSYIIEHYKYLPIILKIFCYSICLYAGLAFLPVFSVRAQELVGVIDFIAIPLLAFVVRPHWLGRLAVVIYAVGIFIADLYLYDYLKM